MSLSPKSIAIQTNLLQSAQTLNSQARSHLETGNAEAALNTWKQAEVAYQNAKDEDGIIGSQLNQAQALQALGRYRLARDLLSQINQILAQKPDSELKVIALRSFGDILRLTGDLKQSENTLQKSLDLAVKMGAKENAIASKLSLGNTAFAFAKRAKAVNDETQAQTQTQRALQFYQAAARETVSPTTKLRSLLNLLNLLLEDKNISDAQILLPQISAILTELPASRLSIEARINYAKNLLLLKHNPSATLEVLKIAIDQAKSLQNKNLESYGLGYLGRVYEANGQDLEAVNLTNIALSLAQSIQAQDIVYQWQWQLGRIYAKIGQLENAIAAYKEAVNNLQSLRENLGAINPEAQFSFRDEVEPIYRQFVDLLLQPEPNQANLQTAIEQIDALQLAEIENFLGCKVPALTVNQEIDKQAAIVYPIVLEKRLAVIFQVAGQPLQYHETLVSQQTVEKTLKDLRGYLSESNSKTPEVIQEAQKISQWIVKPFEQILAQSNSIKTLVFVLDGTLRNIPMAVLYDSEREEYLIEKDYAIAVAPRLELFAPKPLEQKLKVFVGGVGEPQFINNQPFEKIEYLEEELTGIGKITTINKPLLNAGFTKINIQNQIEQGNFSAIHIKTHGVFSSDPDNTFIVAYQDILKGEDLANLVKTGSDIELLVLSACQTAEGDNRAVLGLAGIAVRAGARSTLSTLWIAQDRATTELMLKFYEELSKPGITRANALHIAQKALFDRYPNPYIWATYVLVGNWL